MAPVLFCMVSCTIRRSAETAGQVEPPARTQKPKVIIGSTIKEAMAIARTKAKAGEYDFIMDHMLSKELINGLIRKHGVEKWRAEFKEGELKQLPYYFGWLKSCGSRTFGNKTILTGQHGCYAEYVKVGDVYLIVTFGQRITSM